ncbi:MAG: S1 RNA-binding domain-containing protein [Ruminococcus sp.]|nr:S1 RNA-binding domain-containing protein [Ruminococcus sp.]
MNRYFPEGELIGNVENTRFTSSREGMEEAMAKGFILESVAVVCTCEHDLIVDLPCGKGIIRREEGAVGIKEGVTRDIALLSRVGKPVCFKVTNITENENGPVFMLSRREAQEECLEQYVNKLNCGDIIGARVTHLEKFGAFVDIGCGIPSLVPIDAISVSRISHPGDRFVNGQKINVIIKGRENGHILLTHKELLGTWQQNADLFSVGQTVRGIVRSSESYGVFIELAPNLAGLAEPHTGIRPGQTASVFIKAILPDKMKIKLIIVDTFDCALTHTKLRYFIDSGHISNWCYSTPASRKRIEAVF